MSSIIEERTMQVHTQWMRVPARLVSIPAVTLAVIAGFVIALSKLSIAAASDDVPRDEPPLHIVEKTAFPVVFEGIASYYAHSFHGRRTANGTRFNMHEFTAAHRWLPFGTILRVTNPSSGECLLVQVNDRGPFVKRRVLDLSYAAANALNVKLGAIRAEGFTPADVLTDSLALLFIGHRYEPYRAKGTAFEIIEELDNFSLALRLHRMYINDADIALAIIPDRTQDGTPRLRYALVRLSPLTVRSDDSVAALVP
ncbi:MAG: hypothetical protein KatS3mg039_0308 [Candidatus Kapaibacterium sp.]|nr:MAG: hypothetical protein KatS3mg039_0308 [Candidatus Kapabacteria bacterium]